MQVEKDWNNSPQSVNWNSQNGLFYIPKSYLAEIERKLRHKSSKLSHKWTSLYKIKENFLVLSLNAEKLYSNISKKAFLM